MDKTAWKTQSLEWTDGRSLRWQLPILWRIESFPWSPPVEDCPTLQNGQMDVPSSWVNPILQGGRLLCNLKRQEQLPNGKTCALSLLTGWRRWLVHHPKTEGDHLKNIEIVAALFVVMPIHYLVIWKMWNVIQIYLRCTCVPTFKKSWLTTAHAVPSPSPCIDISLTLGGNT